jgi:hypothetical protein
MVKNAAAYNIEGKLQHHGKRSRCSMILTLNLTFKENKKILVLGIHTTNS